MLFQQNIIFLGQRGTRHVLTLFIYSVLFYVFRIFFLSQFVFQYPFISLPGDRLLKIDKWMKKKKKKKKFGRKSSILIANEDIYFP